MSFCLCTRPAVVVNMQVTADCFCNYQEWRNPVAGPLILDISLHMHAHEAIWQKQNPACWSKCLNHSEVKPVGCKFVVLAIILIHRSTYQVRKIIKHSSSHKKRDYTKPLSEWWSGKQQPTTWHPWCCGWFSGGVTSHHPMENANKWSCQASIFVLDYRQAELRALLIPNMGFWWLNHGDKREIREFFRSPWKSKKIRASCFGASDDEDGRRMKLSLTCWHNSTIVSQPCYRTPFWIETMSAPFSYNTYDSLPDAPKFELTSGDITEGGTMPPPQLSKGKSSFVVHLIAFQILGLALKFLLIIYVSMHICCPCRFHIALMNAYIDINVIISSIWSWRRWRCISFLELERIPSWYKVLCCHLLRSGCAYCLWFLALDRVWYSCKCNFLANGCR